MTLAPLKQLFLVFTNKILLIEWILQILRDISIYFLNKKARLEVDQYSEENDSIDMRNAPLSIRQGMIHDESILKMMESKNDL